MGYKLYRKDNGEFIAEFTHQHLAEKRAKELGDRPDFTIDYVKKEEGEFPRESILLFDGAISAFDYGREFMNRERR